MELLQRQHCMIPAEIAAGDPECRNVSNYVRHLKKIDSAENIPEDYLSCGIHVYLCPACSRRKTRLTLFFPGHQKIHVFERGELDSVLR